MLDEATETSINSEKKIFFVQIDSFPFLSFLHQAWLSPPLMTCTSCSFADKEEERKQWKIDAKLSSPSRMSLKLLRFFSTVFFFYPMHERLHILCKFSSGFLRCDLYVRTKRVENHRKTFPFPFFSPRCQIYLFESDRICSCTKRWLDLLFWPQNIQSPSFDHENMKFPQKLFLFFLQISSRLFGVGNWKLSEKLDFSHLPRNILEILFSSRAESTSTPFIFSYCESRDGQSPHSLLWKIWKLLEFLPAGGMQLKNERT